MGEEQVKTYLKKLPDWKYKDGAIVKSFIFEDFHHTMAFVNAVAWIAHQENHHPDLEVSYTLCTVKYRTHAIQGLSENDFICAAKIEEMLK